MLTLSIFLFVPNLVGGLILLARDLKELVSSHKTFGRKSLVKDKYFRTLGRRANFRLHIVVAFISYIIFGHCHQLFMASHTARVMTRITNSLLLPGLPYSAFYFLP